MHHPSAIGSKHIWSRTHWLSYFWRFKFYWDPAITSSRLHASPSVSNTFDLSLTHSRTLSVFIWCTCLSLLLYVYLPNVYLYVTLTHGHEFDKWHSIATFCKITDSLFIYKKSIWNFSATFLASNPGALFFWGRRVGNKLGFIGFETISCRRTAEWAVSGNKMTITNIILTNQRRPYKRTSAFAAEAR